MARAIQEKYFAKQAFGSYGSQDGHPNFECCQSSGKRRTGIFHIQSYNFKVHSLTILSEQK